MSDAFREVASLLFGEQIGEEFAKKQMTPKEREKFQRRQAQIGLASNAVGMTAGAAGLSAALRDDRLKSGGKLSRKMYSVGTGVERAAEKTKAGKNYYKWVAKPGVAPKLAAGAVALQGANLAGDAVANRVLARASKKDNVKKSDPGSSDVHIPGKGTLRNKAVEYGEAKARQKAPELKRGALKVLNQTPELAAKVKQTGKKKVSKSVTWEGEISKVDTDKRQVFGWASIVEINGEPVVDLQGDYIDHDELEKSAYDYVIKSRKGGNMHLRDGDQPVHVSDMIESFLVTPEKKEKLGLPDEMPTGWWVGYQINDDDAWNLVKSGKRTGFSIHGRGQRTPYDEIGKKAPLPKIGRGQYIHAPRLRDKAKSPRWMANAIVNNPGTTAAVVGGTGGTLVLVDPKKIKKSDDRRDKKKSAAGMAAGGGAAHLARVGADYGTKEIAERQLAPYNAKGKGWNYGPYKDDWEHKPLMNKYKRTAKGDPRTKAKMFDENFPKGVHSYKARKVGVLLNKPGVVAGTAVTGALVGGAYGHKRSKQRG